MREPAQPREPARRPFPAEPDARAPRLRSADGFTEVRLWLVFGLVLVAVHLIHWVERGPPVEARPAELLASR